MHVCTWEQLMIRTIAQWLAPVVCHVSMTSYVEHNRR